MSQYERDQVSQLKDLDKKIKETELQQVGLISLVCIMMTTFCSLMIWTHFAPKWIVFYWNKTLHTKYIILDNVITDCIVGYI